MCSSDLKYRLDDLHKTLEEFEAELGVPRIRQYDFIVVGGGSAGCLVAARLAEKFQVLLLEAGGNPVPAVSVPAYASHIALHPEINYDFPFVQHTLGVFHQRPGKMLGGSYAHSSMIHNRGHPRDFDNWAALTGDPSWLYTNVLQYFKKYEKFVGVLFEEGTEDSYGHEGPLVVDTYMHPMYPVWFAAARELGYGVFDPNGYQKEGMAASHVMIRNGTRVTSYYGMVEPAEGQQTNLTVLRYSDATQVSLPAVFIKNS